MRLMHDFGGQLLHPTVLDQILNTTHIPFKIPNTINSNLQTSNPQLHKPKRQSNQNLNM